MRFNAASDEVSLRIVGDELILRCPYDEELVEAIKSSFWTRRWHSDSKTWTFPACLAPKVYKLVIEVLGISIPFPKKEE